MSTRRGVEVSEHLTRCAHVHPPSNSVHLDALGKIRVLHDDGPEPAVAAGLLVCERRESESALDDEKVLMSVERDPARGGQVGEDGCL